MASDMNKNRNTKGMKISYKERAKNGGSYSAAAKAVGLSGKAGKTGKAKMKGGGKMGKCKGGC